MGIYGLVELIYNLLGTEKNKKQEISPEYNTSHERHPNSKPLTIADLASQTLAKGYRPRSAQHSPMMVKNKFAFKNMWNPSSNIKKESSPTKVARVDRQEKEKVNKHFEFPSNTRISTTPTPEKRDFPSEPPQKWISPEKRSIPPQKKRLTPTPHKEHSPIAEKSKKELNITPKKQNPSPEDPKYFTTPEVRDRAISEKEGSYEKSFSEKEKYICVGKDLGEVNTSASISPGKRKVAHQSLSVEKRSLYQDMPRGASGSIGSRISNMTPTSKTYIYIESDIHKKNRSHEIIKNVEQEMISYEQTPPKNELLKVKASKIEKEMKEMKDKYLHSSDNYIDGGDLEEMSRIYKETLKKITTEDQYFGVIIEEIFQHYEKVLDTYTLNKQKTSLQILNYQRDNEKQIKLMESKYKEEREDLERNIYMGKEEIERLNIEIGRWKVKVEDLVFAHKNELKLLNSKLESEVNAGERKLEEEINIVNKLKGENRGLKVELETTRKVLQDHGENEKTRDSKLLEVYEELEDAKFKNGRLHEEIDLLKSIRSENEAMTSEIDIWKSQLRHMEGTKAKVSALDEELRVAKLEKYKLTEEVSVIKRLKEESEAKIAKGEDRSAREVVDLNKKINDIKYKNKELEEEIGVLRNIKSENQKMRTKIELLEIRLVEDNTNNKRVKILSNELKVIKEESRKYIEEIKELKGQNDHLRVLEDEKRNILKLAKDKLQEDNKNKQAQNENYRSIYEELNKLKEVKARMAEELRDQKVENKQLKTVGEEMREAINRAELKEEELMQLVKGIPGIEFEEEDTTGKRRISIMGKNKVLNIPNLDLEMIDIHFKGNQGNNPQNQPGRNSIETDSDMDSHDSPDPRSAKYRQKFAPLKGKGIRGLYIYIYILLRYKR